MRAAVLSLRHKKVLTYKWYRGWNRQSQGLQISLQKTMIAGWRGREQPEDLAMLLRTADLVITGEGRMDAQTLMGKTPAGVARLAKKYAVPVIAYAGCFGDGIEQCTESGLFDRVYAVTEQEGAFDPQMAVRDLGQKVRETMSEWIHMIDTKKGANE